MSSTTLEPSHEDDARRWAVCFGAVAALHALPLLVLAWGPQPANSMAVAPPAVVMVDMTPEPVAAPAPSEPTSADPKPQRGPPTPPEPMRQPKILRVREAAVTMPAAADMPRRAEDNAPAQRAMAPPATATPSAAAQVRSAAAFNAGAAPTWQGLLLGHLEQFKRYPGMAQQHGQQGVVYLRFTMNREGEVLSAKIERSSGYDLLDEETLALIRRAQPLPKPPPEVAGDTLELTVPVEFFLRGR